MDEVAETRGATELEALALRKALDGANAEIARLERIIVDLERAELSTQSELSKAISDLEATRRADPEQLEQATAELAVALERASRYRGALISILESRSWKVTRPLRMARHSTRPDHELLEELEQSG